MRAFHCVVVALGLGFACACGPAVASDQASDQDSNTSDATTADPQSNPSTAANPDPPSDTTTAGVGPGTTTMLGSSSGSPLCASPLRDPMDVFGIADGPLRGNPDGLVTIVEWMGYQEPFSKIVEQTISELFAGSNGTELRRVIRHNPFDFHPQGELFARAAIAADEQGLFWELHDQFFAAAALDATSVDTLAAQVGLDVEQLRQDMDSAATTAVLEAHQAQALELEALGTPAFFINGLLITGAYPLDTFEDAVSNELAMMQSLLDQGLDPCEAYTQRLSDNLSE